MTQNPNLSHFEEVLKEALRKNVDMERFKAKIEDESITQYSSQFFLLYSFFFALRFNDLKDKEVFKLEYKNKISLSNIKKDLLDEEIQKMKQYISIISLGNREELKKITGISQDNLCTNTFTGDTLRVFLFYPDTSFFISSYGRKNRDVNYLNGEINSCFQYYFSERLLTADNFLTACMYFRICMPQRKMLQKPLNYATICKRGHRPSDGLAFALNGKYRELTENQLDVGYGEEILKKYGDYNINLVNELSHVSGKPCYIQRFLAHLLRLTELTSIQPDDCFNFQFKLDEKLKSFWFLLLDFMEESSIDDIREMINFLFKNSEKKMDEELIVSFTTFLLKNEEKIKDKDRSLFAFLHGIDNLKKILEKGPSHNSNRPVIHRNYPIPNLILYLCICSNNQGEEEKERQLKYILDCDEERARYIMLRFENDFLKPKKTNEQITN